jgi:hypothetical protein
MSIDDILQYVILHPSFCISLGILMYQSIALFQQGGHVSDHYPFPLFVRMSVADNLAISHRTDHRVVHDLVCDSGNRSLLYNALLFDI